MGSSTDRQTDKTCNRAPRGIRSRTHVHTVYHADADYTSIRSTALPPLASVQRGPAAWSNKHTSLSRVNLRSTLAVDSPRSTTRSVSRCTIAATGSWEAYYRSDLGHSGRGYSNYALPLGACQLSTLASPQAVTRSAEVGCRNRGSTAGAWQWGARHARRQPC